MSIEQDSKYYDNYYKDSLEYKLHYKNSMYYDLWKIRMEIIPKGVKVTELGCGVGQFAEMLFDNGYKNYIGFDFSKEAIEQANIKMNDFFAVSDLTSKIFTTDDNFFVALEIFEHTKDLKIIENLGLGKDIIFTVPDFDYPSHVRYFKSVNEVIERYKNVINFEYVRKYKSWFICKGVTI